MLDDAEPAFDKVTDKQFGMFPYAQFALAVAVLFVALSVLPENTSWSVPCDT